MTGCGDQRAAPRHPPPPGVMHHGQPSPVYRPYRRSAPARTASAASRAEPAAGNASAIAAVTYGVANDVPLHRAQPSGNRSWSTNVLVTSAPGAATVIQVPVFDHSQIR